MVSSKTSILEWMPKELWYYENFGLKVHGPIVGTSYFTYYMIFNCGVGSGIVSSS